MISQVCSNCIDYRRKTKHKGICERFERAIKLIDNDYNVIDIYVHKGNNCRFFKQKQRILK